MSSRQSGFPEPASSLRTSAQTYPSGTESSGSELGVVQCGLSSSSLVLAHNVSAAWTSPATASTTSPISNPIFTCMGVNATSVACTLSVPEAAVVVVAHPLVVDGGGAPGRRAPNLDLNDKLVKRGLVVSWHGYRADVVRVRTGRCLCQWRSGSTDAFRHTATWLSCRSVQVVAP